MYDVCGSQSGRGSNAHVVMLFRQCVRYLLPRQLDCLPQRARRALPKRRYLSGVQHSHHSPPRATQSHRHTKLSPSQYSTQRTYSLFTSSDTVFALSSGHGKCGVAVIRATGPQSMQALMSVGGFVSPPQPRQAVLRKLRDPETRDTIDHGLVLWFPAPNSFTGEDLIEFQVHGGPSVVLAMLSALAKIPGCQHAEPGDFTKRAFFNGRLDLTEVEGLGDLIHAETEAQRKQALRQMEGDLGRMYDKWTKDLLQCVAHVEAFIDFSEDENIEEGVIQQVSERLVELNSAITEHLSDGRRGERLRDGVHVAIVGAPNAGKSSLLNILCQRPAAIVSPQAGTTRDVLESTLDIFGYPIIVSDTAGLRQTSDPVEQEGVRRALKRAETADLKILIADSSLLLGEFQHRHTTREEDQSLTSLARKLLRHESESSADWSSEALQELSGDSTIVVLNKTDLIPQELIGERLTTGMQDISICWVSCKTGNGMDSFMHTLRKHLQEMCGNPLAGNPSITQARHRQHLSLLARGDEGVLDLAAEELRAAIRQLGRVTGKIGVEEILDVVFRDFCIGK